MPRSEISKSRNMGLPPVWLADSPRCFKPETALHTTTVYCPFPTSTNMLTCTRSEDWESFVGAGTVCLHLSGLLKFCIFISVFALMNSHQCFVPHWSPVSFEDPDTLGKKCSTFTHLTGEKNWAGACTLAQLLQQLPDQQRKIKLCDKTCLDFYAADLVASWPARCCPLP